MQGSASDAPSTPRPATGKLGIITPGLGAVATTFMAGVESVRRGHTQPIGSLTQLATIRLGKRTENRSPLIKDFGAARAAVERFRPLSGDASDRRSRGWR